MSETLHGDLIEILSAERDALRTLVKAREAEVEFYERLMASAATEAKRLLALVEHLNRYVDVLWRHSTGLETRIICLETKPAAAETGERARTNRSQGSLTHAGEPNPSPRT